MRSSIFRGTTAFGLLLSVALGASAESWRATNTTGAPEARDRHTAVWTGSKMIVWDGFDNLDDWDHAYLFGGGAYDPATDTWTAVSTVNAPMKRQSPTAVWTGSKMIVWGGFTGGPPPQYFGELRTGGVYDPATDTWAATSTFRAPRSRWHHTAVWTGSRMIVWGGEGGPVLNTGGVYNPATDTWTSTSTTGAPEARAEHTAVWTGSKMIVWGGIRNGAVYLNSGGVYDPATRTWTATSTTNGPSPRAYHVAIWTGSRMIVWGGYGPHTGDFLDTGGVYDPETDTWTTTSMLDAPQARSDATGVRMGSKMIVWGGFASNLGLRLDTGGIYDTASDTWTTMTTANLPSPRAGQTAVWTGSRMIVWGGSLDIDTRTNTGGIYAPPGTEGPLVAGADRVFPLIPQCSIPDGALALSLNLAVTQTTAAGNVRLYPTGDPLPTASSINFSAGQTRSNNAIVRLNASGELTAHLAPSGSAHVILDVNGYFDVAGSFFTIPSCRAVDTRTP
jgi:N-acetylneuraminic acid mutarotase